MKKLRLHCINLGSKAAKGVAAALSNKVGYKVWRGLSTKPNRENIKYGDCVDKIDQYEYFKAHGLPHPPFTKSKTEARDWAALGPVFCRTLTKASEGKGIVVAMSAEDVVPAPVYTKYLKKKKEFRVHIFKDKVVIILEKRKKIGVEDVNTMVRNTANGYVFCRDNVEEPAGIRELALSARKVTNSDFAGVDIGYNVKLNQLFVIEVNSAPGIEGSNVDAYCETILNHYKGV